LHNGKGKMLATFGARNCITSSFMTSRFFTPRVFYSESDHSPVVAEFELPESRIKMGQWIAAMVTEDSKERRQEK
jgi:hypothetical protein